jgi:hypothetical protein
LQVNFEDPKACKPRGMDSSFHQRSPQVPPV